VLHQVRFIDQFAAKCAILLLENYDLQEAILAITN
jgi:hypothetical protein